VDKTIVAQGEDRERQDFLRRIGPQLIQAAKLGAQMAFITGNAMGELADRFLRWLINQLCYFDELELLHQFHFFCNSGGVYVHFPLHDDALSRLMNGGNPPGNPDSHLPEAVFAEIMQPASTGGKPEIRPRFVDPWYIERCRIPDDDVEHIQVILETEAAVYLADLTARRTTYENQYKLDMVSQEGALLRPHVEKRFVAYGSDEDERSATVQITLKPVLSFHQGRQASRLFGRDLRSRLVARIQAQLDGCGLGKYVARPGGRASVDVTLEKVNKAYALEFLIDHLNLQGCARQGQLFGSNAIYFGDEVIAGGGNDFAVTRVPGVLVFAVNPQRELVPLLSHILIPSTILEGPVATAHVLARFNDCAERLLREYSRESSRKPAMVCKTAITVLKEDIYAERTQAMIAALQRAPHVSVEDWQALHTLVTLMGQDDPVARQWLSLLVGEMNAAMLQLSAAGSATEKALC